MGRVGTAARLPWLFGHPLRVPHALLAVLERVVRGDGVACMASMLLVARWGLGAGWGGMLAFGQPTG